jgi:hypothetical protein
LKTAKPMYHAWRLFRVALHLILAAAVLATAYTWITPMMNAQANDPDFEEALEDAGSGMAESAPPDMAGMADMD